MLLLAYEKDAMSLRTQQTLRIAQIQAAADALSWTPAVLAAFQRDCVCPEKRSPPAGFYLAIPGKEGKVSQLGTRARH